MILLMSYFLTEAQIGLESQQQSNGVFLKLNNNAMFPSSMDMGINYIKTNDSFGGFPQVLKLQPDGDGNVTIGNTTATGTASDDARLTIRAIDESTADLNIEGNALVTTQGGYHFYLDNNNNAANEPFNIYDSNGSRVFAAWEDGDSKVKGSFIVGGGNNSGSSANGTLTIRHADNTVDGGIRISNQALGQPAGWLLHHNPSGFLRFYQGGLYEVAFSDDGGVNVLSDRRHKNSINNVDRADILDRLTQLRPVSFKYNHSTSGNTVMGHIAQEVQDVFPELVSVEKDDNDEILSLNLTQFIPVLVSSIQEQQKIIEEMKIRIDELESK